MKKQPKTELVSVRVPSYVLNHLAKYPGKSKSDRIRNILERDIVNKVGTCCPPELDYLLTPTKTKYKLSLIFEKIEDTKQRAKMLTWLETMPYTEWHECYHTPLACRYIHSVYAMALDICLGKGIEL